MSPIREPIGSPPPRRPARDAVNDPVKNLLKANRTQAAGTRAHEQALETKVGSAKKQVTFYMDETDLRRAKAAYLATSGQENDRIWSDFVAQALMNEVKRREATYNDGEPFPEVPAKLTPGRKLAP